jgi:hypothetical protein
MIFVKLDSAVAKVPTDENVSSAIIHSSYMYESLSKIGRNIIWSCCPDIAKSCNLYCFGQYRGITQAILRHTYGTYFRICTKCGAKKIIQIFDVLV